MIFFGKFLHVFSVGLDLCVMFRSVEVVSIRRKICEKFDEFSVNPRVSEILKTRVKSLYNCTNLA